MRQTYNIRQHFLLIAGFFGSLASSAQLSIGNAQLYIQNGATISVQTDISASTNILGAGRILLNGSSQQNVNMNGFTIPNLEINNNANTVLTGTIRISDTLLFTNGKIIADNFDVLLGNTIGSVTGMGTGRFVETNGTGQLIQEITSNISNQVLPVGRGTIYRPAYLTANATGVSTVGIKAQPSAASNKPPMISDYLVTHWTVTRSALTGNVSLAAQYIDSDVNGAETNLRGYYFNNSTTDWSSSGSANDPAINRVTVPVTGLSGTVYGMDKFIAVGAKAFLQAAYSGNSLMNDNLRAGTNIIPGTDPYRTAPYSASFNHVNNPITESATSNAFAEQLPGNNNIVDWVFLELRTTNASPGNTVLQTRSALLQRDGDIVDIDGVSPVTFNNISNGNYALTIRHRNHLGLSTDPITNPRMCSETRSLSFTTNLIDLTTSADAGLFGSANAYAVSADGKNLLWGGNANSNTTTRSQGPGNDRATILTDLSGNELNTITGYFRSDLNFNRQVRYQGPGNDRAYLLATILLNNELSVRTQEIPF